MQPDNQNNNQNLENDHNWSDRPTEMYAPSQSVEYVSDGNLTEGNYVDDELVHWQAKEYISEEKNHLWFVAFGLSVVVLLLIDLLLIKSYTFSAVIVLMAISVLVLYFRPPRLINYTLSGDHGLYIGDKLYHYDEFKSFGLIKHKDQYSLMLIPIKRFSPAVSVFIPENVGEEVVDIFGVRLPMEELRLDLFDILAQKLRL